MNKIYTKKGDQGSTILLNGEQVPKHHLRIQACGQLDELNACLGLLHQAVSKAEHQENITRVQAEIFALSAILATKNIEQANLLVPDKKQIDHLESEIDDWQALLPPLRHFILPQGCQAACLAHLARTICRRAERTIAAVHNHEQLTPILLQYINRLSDWLFMLARILNQEAQLPETIWQQKNHSGKSNERD